jgi:hypothetical protein
MAAPGVSPWGYHQCFVGVVAVLPPPHGRQHRNLSSYRSFSTNAPCPCVAA